MTRRGWILFVAMSGIWGVPYLLIKVAVGAVEPATLVLGLDTRGASVGAVGELALVALCYAVGPMVVARHLTGLRPLTVVSASLSLCALAYAPYALTHLPVSLPAPNALAAIAGLAVVCTAVAFIVFFALIAEAG